MKTKNKVLFSIAAVVAVLCISFFALHNSKKEFYKKLDIAIYDTKEFCAGKMLTCDYAAERKRLKSEAEKENTDEVNYNQEKYILAMMMYYGIGGKKDFDGAFHTLFKCAKGEEIRGAYSAYSGNMSPHPYCNDFLYERFNEDILNNKSDYLKYALMPDAKDLPEVEYALAYYYKYGLGVEQNDNEYAKIIIHLADIGDNEDGIPDMVTYGIPLGVLEKAADIYKCGIGGMKIDYIKSFKYLVYEQTRSLDHLNEEMHDQSIYYERLSVFVGDILDFAKEEDKNNNENLYCKSEKNIQNKNPKYALKLIDEGIYKEYKKYAYLKEVCDSGDYRDALHTIFSIFKDYAMKGNKYAWRFFEKAAKKDKNYVLSELKEREENMEDYVKDAEDIYYLDVIKRESIPEYRKNLNSLIKKIKSNNK